MREVKPMPPHDPNDKPTSIMDLHYLNYFNFSEGEQGARMLRAGDATGLKTAFEVKQRMLEYVHLKSCINTPPKLETLNRRFAKAAKRVDVSTRELVSQLCSEGRVVLYERRNLNVIISAKILEQLKTYNENYLEIIETILSQAE